MKKINEYMQLTFDEDIVFPEENSLLNEIKVLSIPPLLTILTLPYRNIKDEFGDVATLYEKTIVKNQATYHLSIKSGFDHKVKGSPFYGIPYGIYPRLLLYYICSEVNKTKGKEIYLGDSYKGIFENLSIQNSTNKNNLSSIQINRFKDQLNRLLNAQIIASKYTGLKEDNRQESETSYLNLINNVKQVKFWNNESQKDDEGYVVRLTEDFYNLIIKQGATIFDYKLVGLLKNSPISLDLALFLNYWSYGCHRFKKDLHVSYKALYEQFGSNSSQKEFNRKIKNSLKQVCSALPNLYLKLDIVRNNEKGLLLLDISRPSIGMKAADTMRIQEEQQLKVAKNLRYSATQEELSVEKDFYLDLNKFK